MFIENKLKAHVNLRTLKVGKHSRLPAGMATAKEIQTAETLRGFQWGGGFYGYRLKFWLFYGYRLIFFSYG